ncbi:copper homeostasis membrane protein CopD [Kerstersia gyiorum]|uniref:copper homeostasis membrane protein CopD n=1 Tax=Kerstersia gyiorum TaxID=206506 RepID=UPI0010712A07|nr:copper homeostasis membrane protein CopD [Kerstersia gyiorum]MCO7641501.1 copper homeostasis membrane protein CopD [Pseudomonas sp. S 311-6]MCP1635589.1 putative copper resistance protein D [Kerstersia gyiorum]MCP1671005.1 putative copper resistance protein D [Kerstersia gyiorum]MCP1678342.1 putative copper resistance protein D [Kerstersia gyiorum]MCP1708653.1 putative copper resistance protein D [Kerstersia gyiorum]
MLELLPILLRQLHVAGLLLCCGTGIYLGFLTAPSLALELSRPARRVYAACTLLACAGTLLMIPLQAGRMAGSMADILSPDTWQAVLLATRYGEAWQWQFFLLPVLLLAWLYRRQDRQHHRAMALASGAMLAALAATGHAAAMDGALGWLHRGNQTLHLWAIAYWAGGLPWVLVQLRRLAHHPDGAIIQTLVRYSRLGHWAVAIAILSGLGNLFLILGPWPWNWATLYMRLMETKFLAVAAMVALALFNRYVLVPRMRNQPQALQAMAKNTRFEVIFAAGIVILIGVISSLSPT